MGVQDIEIFAEAVYGRYLPRAISDLLRAMEPKHPKGFEGELSQRGAK